jgi:hypothetical protein
VGPGAAEQHDTEERRFKHEGGEAFIAQQRSLDRPSAFREHAPIRPELERHHDAADYAHGERQSEYLEPEIENAPVDRLAGHEPHSFDRGEPGGEPDGERRKNDMEADHECKLQA